MIWCYIIRYDSYIILYCIVFYYLSGFAHSAGPGWRMISPCWNVTVCIHLGVPYGQLLDPGGAYRVHFWQFFGFGGLAWVRGGKATTRMMKYDVLRSLCVRKCCLFSLVLPCVLQRSHVSALRLCMWLLVLLAMRHWQHAVLHRF